MRRVGEKDNVNKIKKTSKRKSGKRTLFLSEFSNAQEGQIEDQRFGDCARAMSVMRLGLSMW